MKTLRITFLLVLFAAFSSTAYAQRIAVKGDTVYTSAGNPIVKGVVLVKDGKIERVGTQSSVRIPSGYEVMEAKVVTPGFIDVHSVVGLAGHMSQPHDQDQLETSSAIQPELRAIDAYNAREELVGHLRRLGVTTVHTGHGPGALMSGQTMIVKTTGETVEEAVVTPSKMIAFTMGSMISGAINKPGTRSKGVAMIRQELVKAQAYAEKRKNGDSYTKNIRMEALADLLDGKLTAMVTVHKANDIMTALRLQKEFDFPMVLDGAADAHLILDEIKDAGVTVFVHPTMIRPSRDAQNASMETAGMLHRAGIPFGFQSGFEPYVPKTRVVLFEAGVAVANGLDRSAAMEILTIEAAKILDIEERVGSLEKGKDADIVLFNGDPFEYTSNVTGVIINGKVQTN